MTIDNSRLVANALLKTDPDLAGSFSNSEAYAAELTEQGARVSLFRDYEKGAHRSTITDQMRAMLRLPEDDSGISDFTDNYCKIIIDKMAGRIHVPEITLPEFEEDETAKAWLKETLERNDFEALQGTVWRGAIRDGDNYVLVDPKTLMWSVEPAYDGFSGVVAIFDGIQKTPIWACKIWAEAVTGTGLEAEDVTSATMRLIVYQEDKITYWFGKEGAAEVYPDNRVDVVASELGDDGGLLEISKETNGFPWQLGKVPLIHFVNQFDITTFMGESELRPAIPLQDVLDRTLHSMVMASEFSAFRIKWSIGMEIDADGITPGAVINLILKGKDGKPLTELSPEMAAFLQAVRVGEFEATDMGQYISQIDRVVRELSQTTQTPIYGVTAEGNLSGEALKQLEIGLIGKCERFQRENADSIRELIQLTSELQNMFTTEVEGDAPQVTRVGVTWAPVEILDNDKQIATLIKMRTDAPNLFSDSWYRRKIGGLLGMSQTEVKEAEQDAMQESQNALETLVGSAGGPAVV